MYDATQNIGNVGEVNNAVTIAATAGNATLVCSSAPLVAVNQRVMLSTSGSLPTVSGVPLSTSRSYYIKTVSGANITLTGNYNGAAYTFDGAGTGIHSMSLVWASEPINAAIDFTTPNNVFQDFANNDFRPAGSGAAPNAAALQVDSAYDISGLVNVDILGKERPQYRNGAAEYKDVGPFEYDFGYTRPASHVLTLDNVVVGSRVFVRDQGGTVTHYDQIAAASTVVITATVYGDYRDQWRIRIRKSSSAPKQLPYETLMTATAGSSSIFVSQVPDTIAS